MLVKVTILQEMILEGKRVFPGEVHLVNQGQWLQAKEQYPDGLIIDAHEVAAPPPAEVESVEVTPHDNEPNPPSAPTRKRRAADSGNAQPSAS